MLYFVYEFKSLLISRYKQEAQLMLRNPRDRMFYVNRVSAYLVPFSK